VISARKLLKDRFEEEKEGALFPLEENLQKTMPATLAGAKEAAAFWEGNIR